MPARRLDELGIVGDSIVLKVSARGYEREVLAGATGLLEAARIKAMTIYLADSPEMAGELERWGFVLLDSRTMRPGRFAEALCVHRKWLPNHD